MEKQDWLWPDRIPCGKVTLFAGKPDCGKSLATLNVIARVTNGSDWPDGTKGEAPREVLLAATEDDLATTLVPRLKAAGADLTKVHLIKRVIVEGKSKTIKRILQLKEDALLIKRLLRDHPQVALIVLDPLTGYFGEVDPNKDKEIRPVMEAMTNAIEQSKTAVVGIIHHNKRSDVDALGKILGGSAVAGVSRAVWGFSRDTENKDEFFMALVKSNLSKKRTGMKYKIGESEVKLGDGSTAQVPFTEWLGETELDANEVLGQERDTKGRKDNKQITLAKEFLGRYVTSGKSRMARDLYAECEKQGISVATLKQAKNEFPETKSVQLTNGWMWRITTSAVSEKTVDTAEIRVEDVL
jgi:RecA-family ATPase